MFPQFFQSSFLEFLDLWDVSEVLEFLGVIWRSWGYSLLDVLCGYLTSRKFLVFPEKEKEKEEKEGSLS